MAQLALDDGADVIERVGRYAVLEPANAGEVRFREDVGARAEDLRELDERGTECGDRRRQPLGPPPVVFGGAARRLAEEQPAAAVAQEAHDERRQPSQDRPAPPPPLHDARIAPSATGSAASPASMTPRSAARRRASTGRTAPAERMYVNASSTLIDSTVTFDRGRTTTHPDV